MAKLKSPLLSFSAHGTLGDVLVFFDRHGKSYARSKPKDPVSLSLAQGVLRDCFASAAVSALSLTQGQKDSYAALAPNSAFCPWYNNFIGQYIIDNYEAPSVATTFIKSVQIVVGTIPNGSSYIDVLCNPIVINESCTFVLGIGAANDDPRNFRAYNTFLDTTHLRLVRDSQPKVGDLIISCMIVHFDPDFIVSLQYKTITFESGDVLATTAIDAVDISKTIVIPAGFLCDSDVNANVWNCYLDLADNTTLRGRRVTSGGIINAIARIIQFI